ncbi:UPF0149 family protein [Devosia sp. XJ19-1]|uniref:UPF0149 family protein n=1 Tax=Devosia ureilytica TaxID=2952754 RepID=A0A9Q4FUK0_9HYPH|nr:UPF0149 family protein [Devosia ureilytica]MCP8884865.1 UPF0149 family protein [Devosia ureilytica]MCP8888624.1 UPF0149 family protein [Devosia ureilytica]
MTSDFSELPPSLQRLDDILADAGDEAMLLTELDGFLCALVVSPSPVSKSEYWPFDWAADQRGLPAPGFEDFEALVDARLSAIEEELSEGAYGPLFEVDEETDDVIWQAWMSGFQQAMLLRFDAWDDLLRDTGGTARGEAAMGLASGLMLVDPANHPDDTASTDEWAQYDAAMDAMPEILAQVAVLLYRLHRQD